MKKLNSFPIYETRVIVSPDGISGHNHPQNAVIYSDTTIGEGGGGGLPWFRHIMCEIFQKITKFI